MGSVCNLPIKWPISIGTMLNFDGDGTCKHMNRPMVPIKSGETDTVILTIVIISQKKWPKLDLQ